MSAPISNTANTVNTAAEMVTATEKDKDMLAAVEDASQTLSGPVQNKVVSLMLGPVPHNTGTVTVVPLSSSLPPPLFS